MPLNPLAPVTDYQSMLNRIFWFTTAAALAAIWMLRLHIPALDALLSRVDSRVGVGRREGAADAAAAICCRRWPWALPARVSAARADFGLAGDPRVLRRRSDHRRVGRPMAEST